MNKEGVTLDKDEVFNLASLNLSKNALKLWLFYKAIENENGQVKNPTARERLALGLGKSYTYLRAKKELIIRGLLSESSTSIINSVKLPY